MDRQQHVWAALLGEMAKEKIQVLAREDLTNADIERLEDWFIREVFPVLTPLAIDPAHPFPFIPNEGFALALQLRRISDGDTLEALLPVPHQVKRFVRLDGGRPT